MPKHQLPTAGETTAVEKRSKNASAKREAAKESVLQNPFAVFTEWTGEVDEQAYAGL
jgi:hypothetical protein